jgi:tetratricopeptide (TPR) repeat protein
LRAERIAAAKDRITEKSGLDEVRFIAQIPYHPLLALEEDPTVQSLEGTDLFEAYEKITETLRDWAGNRPEERMQQAFYLLGRGKTEEAVSVIEQVKQEDPELAIRLLRREASFLVNQDPEHALAALQKGREIAGELKDSQSKAYLLVSTGHACRGLGRVEESIDCYEEALDKFQEIGNRNGSGIAIGSLGHAYSNLGRVEAAIYNYKKAIVIFREINNQNNIGSILISLGHIYNYLGRVEEAIDHYEKGLAIVREISNRRSEGIALGSLGNTFRDLGRGREAIDHYEEALTIFRETSNRREENITLGNLGVAYAQTEQEDEATDALSEARRIAESIGLPTLRAFIYLDEVRAFTQFQPNHAHEALSESWQFIMDHANAFERAESHVLRARLRLEVEDDAEGAAEDARTALDFYRPRDVDSRWSREAEEILEKATSQAT